MIIENNCQNEIIINKSKFITFLYKIKNKDDFIEYYNNLKKEYKDATHICYAYIVNNEIKYDDDKEPNGSAGLPIYEVLKINKLNYIACFVIRYFGGIKLGSSGLIRAYSNSCSLCLKKTTIKKIEQLYKLEIILDYNTYNMIKNFIQKKQILKTEFKDKIICIIIANDSIINKLSNYKINYKILDNNYF